MYISVGVCSTVGRGGEGWGKGTSPLPPLSHSVPLPGERGQGTGGVGRFSLIQPALQSTL